MTTNEICYSCGEGILVRLEQQPDGFTEYFSCGHSRHFRSLEDNPPVAERVSPEQGTLKACVDAGRIVLFPPSRITLGSAANLFRGVVRALLQNGMVDIICDLSQCNYADSAGVAELVVAFTACRSRGGSFSLNRLPPKIHGLLEITKLLTVFSHFEVDYSRHPVLEISPEDVSALKVAQNAAQTDLPSLFLTARDGRIQLLPGRVPGLYRVALGTGPQRETIVAAPYVIADITRTYLHEEVEEFEDLVNSPNCSERAIQKFLESHPKFLLGHQYERLHPQVILERREEGPLIPDFLLQPFGRHFCDVLDLKLPSTQLVVGGRNRERFSAAIAEGAAQLHRYRNYFDDPAGRDSVLTRYGITAYRPHLALVVGRKVETDDAVLYKQMQDGASGVEVITYEDLLTRAKRLLLW